MIVLMWRCYGHTGPRPAHCSSKLPGLDCGFKLRWSYPKEMSVWYGKFHRVGT